MKKCCFIIIVLLFLTFFLPYESVYAETEESKEIEEATQKLSDEVEKILTSSQMDDFLVFAKNYDSDEQILGTDVLTYIHKITEGKIEFSPTDFLSAMTGGLLKEILALAPLILSVVVISALSGMSSGLVSDFNSKSTSKIINIVCLSAILVLISTELGFAIKNAVGIMNIFAGFSETVFPLLFGLVLSLGGSVSAGIYKPAAAMFSGFIISFFNTVIIPLLLCVLVFDIVGKLSDSIRLNKFSSLLSSLAKWLVGSIFGVFISVVTVGGIAGASIDGVSVRTAKFALQSYVPILGGYLSDGFDLMAAGVVLVKNAVGLTGIIFLFGLVLAPIVRLVALIFSLKLTSAITEPLSAGGISEILDKTSDTLKLLVAVVIGTFFMSASLLFLIMVTFNV